MNIDEFLSDRENDRWLWLLRLIDERGLGTGFKEGTLWVSSDRILTRLLYDASGKDIRFAPGDQRDAVLKRAEEMLRRGQELGWIKPHPTGEHVMSTPARMRVNSLVSA